MELVLSTKHLNTYHHPEYNILYSEWAEAANQMSREEFKQDLIAFVEKVKEYRVRGFLTNSQKGHFTMSVEIQEWHDQEIAPYYVEYNLEKIAFVISEKDLIAAMEKGLYSSIALQQAFEEEEAKKLQTRFFDNQEEALKWFM